MLLLGQILFIIAILGSGGLFMFAFAAMGESSNEGSKFIGYGLAVSLLMFIIGWISLFIFTQITGIGKDIPLTF